MRYEYDCRLEDDPDGGIIVTFPDVPEANTFGEDRADALHSAAEALALALRTYPDNGETLPERTYAGGEVVAVPIADALKLDVIARFAESGLSKTELARRLERGEKEARRVLDPMHPTKVPMLERALQALGARAIVETEAA